MKRTMVLTIVFVAAAFLTAQATICNVPGDHPTIQECIDAVSDGDTVLVSTGFYEECIYFNGKNIVVASNYIFSEDELDIQNTIIDGGGNCTVVTFENGEDITAQIVGFTIQNGYADWREPSGYDGGGIYCRGSSPTIRFNIIQGNAAYDDGGGISCDNGSNSIITNNVIESNSTEVGHGGGIICANSNPEIIYNNISGNSANGTGGGINCIDSYYAVISANTITGNSSNGDGGGGIYFMLSSGTIRFNTISDNSGQDGGGIYCHNSNPSIDDNTVTGNSAAGWGGGIFCIYGPGPHIISNTISGNSASESSFGGGGIYCGLGSNPDIEYNVVTDNTARGAIFCDGDSGSICYNTITGNNSGGIYCENSSSPTICHNTIDGNVRGISCNISSPVIRNNIIRNHSAEAGAGIKSSDSYCIIERNSIYANIASGDGGAINCSDSDSTVIRHNDIYENSANAGGGIHCWFSNPTISDNTIRDNIAADGGGILCHSSNPTIEYNAIHRNQALSDGIGAGGGIWLSHESNSEIEINYNTIYKNVADNGGGIYLHSEVTPSIMNNTIADNIANIQGGGILSDLNSNPTIVNTILCNNLPTDINILNNGTVTITYSDICDFLWDGEGNISTDPLFRDAANDDYHLQSITDPDCGGSSDSPCIDAGDPMLIDVFPCCSWGLGSERSDMGAYGGGVEYAEIPPCIYIPGDCNHNGIPLEIGDVISMIGMYRGTLEPQYTCACPQYGDNFAPHADPNGNCITFELDDVLREIQAYRGTATASGCEDCPGR